MFTLFPLPAWVRLHLPRIAAFCLMGSLALVAAGTAPAGPQREFRGVWANIGSFKTPEEAARFIRACRAAHINVIFPIAFERGLVWYRSRFAHMARGIVPGYDPLGYVTGLARAAHIEVHPWFAISTAGPLDRKSGSLMAEHPDWTVVNGEGKHTPERAWLCPGRRAVQDEYLKLMAEVARRYDIQGIHLDYIRYADSGACFCNACRAAFRKLHGIDMLAAYQQLFGRLPVRRDFTGNPLAGPTTAVALAAFDTGDPAVVLNVLGKGKVVLFNWSANPGDGPFATRLMRNALQYLGGRRRPVYILHSAVNAARYGYREYAIGKRWLERLGVQPTPVGDRQVRTLPPKALLMLSYVYLIDAGVAKSLERFVRNGGNLVALDGPTPSIGSRPELQRLFGLKRAGSFFHETRTLKIVTPHEIVGKPAAARCSVNADQFMAWLTQFRCAQITELVRRTREEVCAPRNLKLTAAVFTRPAAARVSVAQDWPRWVDAGWIDLAIPMNYTSDNTRLATRLEECLRAVRDRSRVLDGLDLYDRSRRRPFPPRSPKLAIEQVNISRKLGCRGVVFFDAAPMVRSKQLAPALGAGPFRFQAAPWYPPAAGEPR